MTKLQEVVMFRDRTLMWVVEYIFGGTLVLVLLTSPVLCRAAWTDAHIWAAQLFVVCLGVILLSCASSMRQRMLLAKRIDTLAKQIAGSASGSSDQNDKNR